MSLTQQQQATISFMLYLKNLDSDFYEELCAEYAEDPSSSFAADAFMAQDDDLMVMWGECNKTYFFQLLAQAAIEQKH